MSSEKRVAETLDNLGQVVRATCKGDHVRLTVGGNIVGEGRWDGERILIFVEICADGEETDAIFRALERQLRAGAAS
jgi:hypothetical protein